MKTLSFLQRGGLPVTSGKVAGMLSGWRKYMNLLDMGLVPYEPALAMQESAVAEVYAGGRGRAFLLEHPPTITFGRNGGKENLPFPEAYFTAKGVTLSQTGRGGNITCHFPGQLVVYPVMKVDKRPGGLKRFFFDLEEAVIRTLAAFGIQAERSEGRPGVWIGNRKICSIGIAVKRWITSHGLALNVGADLSLFNEVTPCGLPGVTATSMEKELGRPVAMAEVKAVFAREFLGLFAEEDSP